MTEPDLRELLSDAVADVEPADRLGEIRSRVRRPRRRTPSYAVGALVAAAAVVTAVVVRASLPDPSGSTPVASPTPSATPGLHAAAIYYLGDTPSGPRLFREFHPVPGPGSLGVGFLSEAPDDPDYETLWGPGAFASAEVVDGRIRVGVADASARLAPAGVTPELAALSVQQVVYTLQAAAGDRLPVVFELDDEPLDQLYGVPTRDPVSHAPPLETLSLVSISDPVEGLRVSGTFTARGAASSPEATVPWELLDGDRVVVSGFATATGWLDRLHPWETTVDVSGLEPGTYTFVARTADESDGEGPGPDVDTRTVVIE